MPVYNFSCDCGKEIEKFYPLDKSNIKPICTCGNEMYKDFSKISLSIDQTMGYFDNQLGEYINSTSDRRRIQKQKGFIDCLPGDVSKNKPKQKTDAERKQEYKTVIKDMAYKNNIPLPGVS